MNMHNDVVISILRNKTKLSEAIKETHYILATVVHIPGFDTSRGLVAVCSSDVLIITRKVQHDWIREVLPTATLLTPKMFLSRRPEHAGPILWLHGYVKNLAIASVVFKHK